MIGKNLFKVYKENSNVSFSFEDFNNRLEDTNKVFSDYVGLAKDGIGIIDPDEVNQRLKEKNNEEEVEESTEIVIAEDPVMEIKKKEE